MPWQDRLRDSAYTSPGGTRLTFLYEDVSRQTKRSTVAFKSPDADGAHVQDLGTGARVYPIRAIFTGDDCDLEASAFEALLVERGAGKLEHPIHGALDVVPYGTINRLDELVSAANQSIVEVTFWETSGVIFPTSQGDPASSVLSSVEGFNSSVAEEFSDGLDLSAPAEKTSFKQKFQGMLSTAANSLRAVAEVQQDVSDQFTNAENSINQAIDVLIGDPLTLAFQTAIMLQAPARARAAIGDRLEAYGNLLQEITTGEDAVLAPTFTESAPNEFQAQSLNALTFVTGAVLSVVNTTFSTKTEALSAAAVILTQAEQATAWRDNNFRALGIVDTGAAYQQLQNSAALAAGFLVEISFTLKQERAITLTRPRTIIDLAAELYGSLDDLDFFISSNQFTGSELLEIPRGRRVVFYV